MAQVSITVLSGRNLDTLTRSLMTILQHEMTVLNQMPGHQVPLWSHQTHLPQLDKPIPKLKAYLGMDSGPKDTAEMLTQQGQWRTVYVDRPQWRQADVERFRAFMKDHCEHMFMTHRLEEGAPHPTLIDSNTIYEVGTDE